MNRKNEANGGNGEHVMTGYRWIVIDKNTQKQMMGNKENVW